MEDVVYKYGLASAIFETGKSESNITITDLQNILDDYFKFTCIVPKSQPIKKGGKQTINFGYDSVKSGNVPKKDKSKMGYYLPPHLIVEEKSFNSLAKVNTKKVGDKLKSINTFLHNSKLTGSGISNSIKRDERDVMIWMIGAMTPYKPSYYKQSISGGQTKYANVGMYPNFRNLDDYVDFIKVFKSLFQTYKHKMYNTTTDKGEFIGKPISTNFTDRIGNKVFPLFKLLCLNKSLYQVISNQAEQTLDINFLKKYPKLGIYEFSSDGNYNYYTIEEDITDIPYSTVYDFVKGMIFKAPEGNSKTNDFLYNLHVLTQNMDNHKSIEIINNLDFTKNKNYGNNNKSINKFTETLISRIMEKKDRDILAKVGKNSKKSVFIELKNKQKNNKSKNVTFDDALNNVIYQMSVINSNIGFVDYMAKKFGSTSDNTEFVDLVMSDKYDIETLLTLFKYYLKNMDIKNTNSASNISNGDTTTENDELKVEMELETESESK